MLKTGNTLNEMCASCHAEKRGPFLHDHAAGREKLRELSRSARVEQRPHAGREGSDALPAVSRQQPASGDHLRRHQIAAASNRAIGRSCVNCHSQIHGSNHPAGEKFLR
jgi:hypothetical protein